MQPPSTRPASLKEACLVVDGGLRMQLFNTCHNAQQIANSNASQACMLNSQGSMHQQAI
jgi:hypothetical protein